MIDSAAKNRPVCDTMKWNYLMPKFCSILTATVTWNPLRKLARLLGTAAEPCVPLTHEEITAAYSQLPNMQLTVRIWPEDGIYVAECLELGTVSQGDTKDDAFENLIEATALFLHHADKREIQDRLNEHEAHNDQEVRAYELALG